MRTLTVRRGVLALALLALVFSPGLLARKGQDGDIRPSRGDLAIALLAPTLDQDELEASRRPAWVDATVMIGLVVAIGLAMPVKRGPALLVTAETVTRRRDVGIVSDRAIRAPPALRSS